MKPNMEIFLTLDEIKSIGNLHPKFNDGSQLDLTMSDSICTKDYMNVDEMMIADEIEEEKKKRIIEVNTKIDTILNQKYGIDFPGLHNFKRQNIYIGMNKNVTNQDVLEDFRKGIHSYLAKDTCEFMKTKGYECVKYLGQGSYGMCLLFKDTITQNMHVGKIFHNYNGACLDNLSNEASNLYRVKSNIFAPKYYSSTFCDQYGIIQMEYCEGQKLNDFISKEIERDDVINITGQLVDFLIETRLDDVIHSDIKSENIIINTETKKIKVIDWGLTIKCNEGGAVKLPEYKTKYHGPEYDGKTIVWSDALYKVDMYSIGLVILKMVQTLRTNNDKIMIKEYANKMCNIINLRPSMKELVKDYVYKKKYRIMRKKFN